MEKSNEVTKKEITKFVILKSLPALLISIACSFISDYKVDLEKINDWKTILWILICKNPYIYILIGAIILLYDNYKMAKKDKSLINLEKENKDLDEKNKNLKIENDELRSELNRTQEESASLKEKISLARKELVDNWLKGLFKQFKLTTHDRVSIYCVVKNNTEDNFHMVHRYSDNPSLCSTTIHQYPLRKGVIYEAWCHNKCYENQCPLYDEKNKKEYIEYISRKYNYKADEITNIRMKSCRYLGLSIKEKGANIGVIIFESIKASNLEENSISKIEKYCKDYNEYLCGFIREYILDINEDNKVRNSLSNNDNDKETYKELLGS